jgi:hypothetical protein
VLTQGIEAASSLSQQGLAAAEAAAEQAARGLSDAATGGLNAAATAVGGTAGALDGVAAAARGDTPRSRQPRGSSNGAPAASSGDFDTVSVRVPASAWANATREKGRVRDMTLTQDFDEVGGSVAAAWELMRGRLRVCAGSQANSQSASSVLPSNKLHAAAVALRVGVWGAGSERATLLLLPAPFASLTAPPPSTTTRMRLSS